MRTIKSFKYAWNGLKTVWKEEVNFRIEFFVGLVVLFLAFYFDLNSIEFSLIIFTVVLVLVSEIINTIVEDLCNKIEPNQDSVVGKIKDLSASFVLLSNIGSLIVWIFIFYTHFF